MSLVFRAARALIRFSELFLPYVPHFFARTILPLRNFMIALWRHSSNNETQFHQQCSRKKVDDRADSMRTSKVHIKTQKCVLLVHFLECTMTVPWNFCISTSARSNSYKGHLKAPRNTKWARMTLLEQFHDFQETASSEATIFTRKQPTV